MIQKLKGFYNENKNKTKIFSIAFSTVLARSVVNVFIAKIIAITSAPGTLALYSQLVNISAITTNLTTGSVTTGVVKLASENSKNTNALAVIRSTVFKLNTALGFIISAGFLFFAERLSIYLFSDPNYKNIVSAIGISSYFSGLVLILTSLANGLGLYRQFFIISMVSSLVLLLSMLFSNHIFQTHNFLFSYLFAQWLSFLFILPSIVKSKLWSLHDYITDKFSLKVLSDLGNFALMSIAATLLVNFSQIGIRLFIIGEYSTEVAGHWDAMMKFSNAYFGFLTAGLGIYFLPKIAACTTKVQIVYEIRSMLKILFPILILMLSIIFLFKNNIILLLYSKDFLIINNYFLPILICDLFKWLGWLFAYILMAKSATTKYLINETIITILLIGVIVLFSNIWGVLGIYYAYPIVFFIYFISSYFFSQIVIKNYK